MGLTDIDIEAVLRRLADHKIEEAFREGKFDNLPGRGKPLDLEPMPPGESARLRWWALRILKQNDVIPDEVVWRKQIDRMKDELAQATTGARVAALVNAINERVRQINTLGTTALTAPVVPVTMDVELRRLSERRAAQATVAPAGNARSAPRIRTCRHGQCGGRNPLAARFCRRCGTPLSA